MSKVLLTFGEVMMRLNPTGVERLAFTNNLEMNIAGSEANVAVDYSLWGGSAHYFTSLPQNDLGLFVKRILRGYNVDVSRIIDVEDSRLGILFLEKGSNLRPSKVTYDRSESALHNFKVLNTDFSSIFKDIDAFHVSGITPALSAELAEFTIKLLSEAKQRDISISVDLNYRSKLWSYTTNPMAVMSNICKYADLLIGNEEDFEKLLGIGSDFNGFSDSFAYIAKSVFKKYPNVSYVAQSNRQSKTAEKNNWSGAIATKKTSAHSTLYSIDNIVDRVGAGDSFAAGIIRGMDLYGDDLDKVINFAVAASYLKHTIPGDFCTVTMEEILRFMDRGRVDLGRIVR